MATAAPCVRFEARVRQGDYRYRACNADGDYVTGELSEEELEEYYRRQGNGEPPAKFDYLITAANNYGTTDTRLTIPLESDWSKPRPVPVPLQAAAIPAPVQPAPAQSLPWWKKFFFWRHPT